MMDDLPITEKAKDRIRYVLLYAFMLIMLGLAVFAAEVIPPNPLF